MILLCGDGIWEPLGDDVLRQTLGASDNVDQWLTQLDGRLQALARPEQDNYTALALFVHPGGES